MEQRTKEKMIRHGFRYGRWYSTRNPWLRALSKIPMGVGKRGTMTMRTELKESNISEIDANNQINGYRLAAHLHQERLTTFEKCPTPFKYEKSTALMKHIKKSRRKIHLVEVYNPGLSTVCKTKNFSACTTSIKDTTCRNCLYKYLKQILDWDMICKFYNDRMDKS